MLDCTIAYGLDFLFPAADTAVGASLKTSGEFSRVELEFMLDVAGPAGTLIDVGANIGSIALPFARVRHEWSVVAVEASRMIAGLLSANALNNRLYNVSVVNAAVGPSRSVVEFPALGLGQKGNFGGIGLAGNQPGGATELVAMLTLDDLANGSETLIKLDVEGFELDVLEGAARTLQRGRAVWLVETSPQVPEKNAAVMQRFKACGYRLYWLFVPFATPRSAKGMPASPLLGDVNVVAMPPGRESSWPLDEVDVLDGSLPPDLTAFPYLQRYGYQIGKRTAE